MYGAVALVALALSGCGGNARDSAGSQQPAADAGSSSAGAGFPQGYGASAGAAQGNGANAGSANGTAGSGTAGVVESAGGAGVAGAPSKPHPAIVCDKPTPRPRGGGYAQCADGSLRRPSAGICESALPRPAPDFPLVKEECASDVECTSAPHGFCAYGTCEYGCVVDSECPESQACFCGEAIGVCVPATCRDDADCPADFPCTAFKSPGYAVPDALSCQSPLDECLTNAQCHSLNPRVSCKVQEAQRICYLDPVG